LVTAAERPSTIPAASAQQPPTAELEEARHHLHELTAQEAAVLASYQTATARVTELNGRIAALDARIADVSAQLAAAEQRLAAAVAAVEAAEQRLAVARQTLAAAEDHLIEQAVSAYVGEDMDFQLSTEFLSAVDLTSAQASRSYGQIVLSRQVSAIDEHRVARENAQIEATALAAARDQATAARDQVADQRAELQTARSEVAAVHQQAAAEQATQRQLLGQVQAQRVAYEQRVAQLEAESRRIAELLRSRNRGGGGPPPASINTRLSNPLPRMVITSGFGWRTHPVYGRRRFHAGIDLDADSGDPIYAAAGGVVAFAGWRGGYGNCVIIDHGGGVATLYGHMSAISVGTGQSLGQGAQVGAVGSTGLSTGPHLHFEVRINGEPVDPVPYLPL
jgi:murein DD-endopeptidase MepM/ murein hydrolase activator NlpD